MNRLQRNLLIIAGVGLGVLGAAAAWVNSLVWTPAPEEDVPVQNMGETTAAPVDQPLKVLVWNLQYGGSRQFHFFYDGGEAVSVPEDVVNATLEQIAAVIEDAAPDLVILQEVDRGSDRTHRIDQHEWLRQRLGYPSHVSTPYHRAGYVPHPSQEHMGKVDMHLSVFSKHTLGSAMRTQLPLLDEPAWRQAFNLKRGLLDVTVETVDGQPIHVLNTHLSAFSKGDGTLTKQMNALERYASALESSNARWILAGDMNSLAPGADASALGPDATYYQDDPNPIELLFRRFQPLISEPQFQQSAERWRTYVPFGADAPDRTLDYVFLSRTLSANNAEVLQEMDISDHLPLIFELELTGAATP